MSQSRVIVDHSGFSLLEVMAVAVLLAICTYSASSLLTSEAVEYGDLQRSAIALQIEESLMEDLLERFSSDSYLTAGAHTLYYDQSGSPAAAGAVFTTTWTVQTDTPVPGILQITLSTAWKFRLGVHSVSLVTYRSSS